MLWLATYIFPIVIIIISRNSFKNYIYWLKAELYVQIIRVVVLLGECFELKYDPQVSRIIPLLQYVWQADSCKGLTA